MEILSFEIHGEKIVITIPEALVPHAVDVAEACRTAAVHYAAIRDDDRRGEEFRRTVKIG